MSVKKRLSSKHLVCSGGDSHSRSDQELGGSKETPCCSLNSIWGLKIKRLLYCFWELVLQETERWRGWGWLKMPNRRDQIGIRALPACCSQGVLDIKETSAQRAAGWPGGSLCVVRLCPSSSLSCQSSYSHQRNSVKVDGRHVSKVNMCFEAAPHVTVSTCFRDSDSQVFVNEQQYTERRTSIERVNRLLEDCLLFFF